VSRVLLLGGGGTLGAFSAGALDVLLACGWVPDVWIGSSAGAINLLRCFAGGPTAPGAFWRRIGPLELLRQVLTHDPRKGLLHAARFRARVDEGVDYAALHRDPRTFGFIVVDLVTGHVTVRSNRTEPTADALRTVAAAAYALPPLLPPIAHGDELLSDGGLLRNAPLHVATELGATEIVYLNNVHALPHTEAPRAGRRSLLRSTLRYTDVFFRRASNVGYVDAEIVEDRYRGVSFLTIAPPATLGIGSLVRWMRPTTNAMEFLIEQGRISARAALAAARLCDGLRGALARVA
jgi:predicted acylesterase/phospholipase RssA